MKQCRALRQRVIRETTRKPNSTRDVTSSTVCLRLCSDGSSICYSTVTLNFFWSPNLTFTSVPQYIIGVSLVKIRLTIFKTLCMLTRPESVVSSIPVLHSTVILTFDPKLWSVHLRPVMHRWCTFGENVSNTLQNIVLTMFWDARTDARTNKTKPVCLRPHYAGRRHNKIYTLHTPSLYIPDFDFTKNKEILTAIFDR